MRLLNATTLEVEEFFDGHAPKYGILSHRWLDGEITLQEIQTGTASKKPGYQKVADTCARALLDGLEYAWVDTCCIDKTSSAELSEAINSMYRWYREAEICYAFLNDVSVDEVSSGDGEDEFANSVWFTRGWALQELIAPERVDFYNASWRKIGTKATLRIAIAATTQIDVAMLEAGGELEDYSIATRMSWASRRVTTRREDLAYCLLGIFGVNMPMLYGEGDRAFIRLQEEIMKHSDDHSLFAWSSDADENVARGLLARSPSDFANCSDINVTSTYWNKAPYAISNLGLSIQLLTVPWTMDTYLAALDCKRGGQRLGIFLRLLPRDNRYARVVVGGEDIIEFAYGRGADLTYRDVYVQQRQWGAVLAPERFYGFWLRTLLSPVRSVSTESNQDVSEVINPGEWDDEKRVCEIPTGEGGTAAAIFLRHEGRSTTIKVGLDDSFNPCVQVGGNLFSPEIGTLDIYSDEGRLHPSWMDAPSHSMFLHRGTRQHGLRVNEHPWCITVFNGIIPGTGKMGWVVDIENWESEEERGKELNRICDGCGIYIHRIYHKCTLCNDFDYCAKCVKTANESHMGHEFEAIE